MSLWLRGLKRSKCKYQIPCNRMIQSINDTNYDQSWFRSIYFKLINEAFIILIWMRIFYSTRNILFFYTGMHFPRQGKKKSVYHVYFSPIDSFKGEKQGVADWDCWNRKWTSQIWTWLYWYWGNLFVLTKICWSTQVLM